MKVTELLQDRDLRHSVLYGVRPQSIIESIGNISEEEVKHYETEGNDWDGHLKIWTSSHIIIVTNSVGYSADMNACGVPRVVNIITIDKETHSVDISIIG